MLSVGDVIPYNNNPKEHPAEQIDRIIESIREYGMDDPIAIDENNVIIEGHGRLLALKQMGIESVPCIRLSHLTAEQKRAYSIAHNKLTLGSGFDLDKLREEFDFLNEAGYSLLNTGFTAAELDGLFNISAPTEGEDDNFDVTKELEKPCLTKKGDLWMLGRHRLIAGDSTEERDIAALLEGAEVDLVVTDPPYNVDYEGWTEGKLKIANDNMGEIDFYSFLVRFLGLAKGAMTDKASIYMFYSQSEGLNFRKAFLNTGFHFSDTLIWKKNSFVLGRVPYQRMYEGIMYGWKAGGTHEWFSDRKQSNVLEFDRPVRSEEHPTMKPIPLIAYLIKNSSKEGQAVYDPFGGSGSTLIACEQTGRVCYTAEIDTGYCDVIVKRYIKQVGNADKVFVIRNGKRIKYVEAAAKGGRDD
jgi:DNA modification methylase